MQPEPQAASIAGASAPPERHVVTITRLSKDVYQKFEDSLPKAVIDKGAPDAGCDASFKLGIQYVLTKLRADLAVE